MKKLLTIAILLFTTILYAQKINASFAQDVKMAYEGPHNNGGMLNPEITIEFEFNNMKGWMAIEWLDQIDYLKWTYLGLDFKLVKLFKENVILSLGPEISGIVRYTENQDYTHPTNYQQQKHFYSYGANATIDIWLNNNIAIITNTNVFKAEPYDNFGNEITQDYRWDVRIGFKFTIININ